MNIIVVRMW